jgi:diadenylate cyclase
VGADLFDQLQGLLSRVGSYPLWAVAVELALIWAIVYAVVRFVQGTRAAGALKGLVVVAVLGTVLVRVLGGGDSFERIGYLYDRLLALVAIALIVIFQPELRRALIRLGETSWFRVGRSEVAEIAAEIADACAFLSKAKFGGLIVVERQVGLRGLLEGGTILNADLTSRLLQTVFYPGTPLHDLAVLVRGKTVVAAGVQLPLADAAEVGDPNLGSRHRAAVGISKESDALVIVVSEETGGVRFAERGRLSKPVPLAELETAIILRLGAAVPVGPVASASPAASLRSGQSASVLMPRTRAEAEDEGAEGLSQAGVDIRDVAPSSEDR